MKKFEYFSFKHYIILYSTEKKGIHDRMELVISSNKSGTNSRNVLQ